MGGLPLHPLLVHLVVIGLPAAAVAVALHACWPAARRRLGIVTVLLAAAMMVVVPITASSGSALAKVVGGSPAIGVHASRAALLTPLTAVLLVVAVAVYVWFRFVGDVPGERPPARIRTLVRILAIGASVVIAAAVIIAVVLVGDAGARSVWGGLI